MSKNRNKKKVIKTQTINRVSLIISIVLSLVCVVETSLLIRQQLSKEEIDTYTLFTNAAAACNEYEYAELSIVRQEELSGETYTAEYVVSGERDGGYRTYMFRDTEANDLYQCWNMDESGVCDVYIRSDEFQTWVYTQMDQEPVTTDLWNSFYYANGYALMDELYTWDDTGDACYVMQLFGSVEGWSECYEEVYIRKSDFLPLGIVMMVSNMQDVSDHADIEAGLQVVEGGVDGDEYYGYDSIIQKYSFTWSHEDMRLFDIPDTYITDEDYLSLTGSTQSSNSEEVSDDGEH